MNAPMNIFRGETLALTGGVGAKVNDLGRLEAFSAEGSVRVRPGITVRSCFSDLSGCPGMSLAYDRPVTK